MFLTFSLTAIACAVTVRRGLELVGKHVLLKWIAIVIYSHQFNNIVETYDILSGVVDIEKGLS